jgi:phosphinothricin acetyltransferase
MAEGSESAPMIRAATGDDAAGIASIYNHYIHETIITFEETPVDSNEMVSRIDGIRCLGLPWLVAETPRRNGNLRMIGYAYAGKFRERASYRFTVETAIYLDPEMAGQGLGTALYRALLSELRQLKLHRAIGGIALPNDASVRLHERLGFKRVGVFTQVGFKFGQWIDVGFWELDLRNADRG